MGIEWFYGVVFVLWLAAVAVGVFLVHRRVASETARPLWVLVILLIPFLGTAAFIIAGPRPGRDDQARH